MSENVHGNFHGTPLDSTSHHTFGSFVRISNMETKRSSQGHEKQRERAWAPNTEFLFSHKTQNKTTFKYKKLKFLQESK